MIDIMVDLETLDTRASASILSIGAVRLDWNTLEAVDPFYIIIDPESCKAVGLTESASTVAWWGGQSEEARRVFTDPNVPLSSALHGFARYLSSYGKSKVRLWGNGSDFDNVILINAYDALGYDAPWMFYNNRCFRTVRKMLGHLIEDPKRGGTHHNALDDAIFQAQILLQLKDHLKI